MTSLRTLVSALLSKGVLSAGWDSILTGLALVVVGLALASVSRDDPAAGIVSWILVLAGAWRLGRSLRLVLSRRRRTTDDGPFVA